MQTKPKKANYPVIWTWFFILALTPIILWIIPSDTFDDLGIKTCPSLLLFDIECWGCGITRAVLHFHHLEFADAAYYNRLVFFVYPFLVYLWIRWIKEAILFLFVKK